MYVGLKMLTDFVTITSETLVSDADRIMENEQLWMLLVKDGDKLAGYVRKEDVRKALPSDATTLERHELNYLLSKLKIGKIMHTDLTTVSPETEIEEAAEIMFTKNIAGLAVVDVKNNLLGFINRNVMLDVLVEEMGLRQGGSRIVFEVEDRTGVIHEVSGIIMEMGISIISTGTFFHNGTRIVVFRVQADDPTPIAKELSDRGYKLVGPDTFKENWK
ncbi:CBS domain-containing protein [Desulfovibrio ferrophilus]|uniref:Acetoin utilization protein n=1 Tax=Desulfovibrio ferrophilus TaxID=241368 RepID=A0A2Z6AW30_9BACT|nr:CBS domain-containing protein [Desulfovibrio ferrophilus]BBD07428.1 acetoin utilization protein [Desulfovibrio ferrophilus]